MRSWKTIGLASVIALSLLAGCGKTEDASAPVEEGTQIDATAIPVSVEELKEGVLSRSDRIIGEINANTSISLFSKVSGTLVGLTVKKGDSVKNGQVIGKLDPSDYLLAVKQAEAALAVAKASLQQAQSGKGLNPGGTSQELASQGIELYLTMYERAKESAEQGLRLAQANYERNKALFEANAISASDMEQEEKTLLQLETQYKAQIDQAESSLLQAKSQLNQAVKSEAQTDAGIQVAQARVKQAQVDVERARNALTDSEIKATADGIITDVKVEVGDSVNPQAPIASLIHLDPAIVKLNITENNRLKFKQGMEMDISVPSLQLKTKGKVSYVGLEASAQTKMFPVELEVTNPDRALLPGMKVDVSVNDLEEKKGLLISTDAIIEEEGKKVVYVIEGDTAVKREIALTEGNTKQVIVESGLNAGDKVVVKGHSQLKDQAKVVVK
ncbi:efflux RND transporter periplasmic adaptor subunit [Ammoniphilus sp. 3BR4]|uniref:efflux RND transporter periplasmic adaptor subunit n=1 Tax=Ammoniphilus sp. 3BR4 TaxID=3158265 RepID=UPI003464FBB8